jgi:hypothetical protein
LKTGGGRNSGPKSAKKPASSPNFCRFFFFFFLPLPQETDTVFLQLHRCNHWLNHLITAATTPSAKRTARGRRSREEQRRKPERGEKKEKDPKERERRDDRDRRQKKKINRGRTNKKKEKQGQHEGIKVWKNTQEPDQARRTRRENVHLAEKNKKKTHHH